MKKPEFMKSERGVSPVIGVILMVAITVILAAVIGSFVLGIGGDVEKAPQASLTVDDGQLVHQGGDSLSNIDVVDASGTSIDNPPGTPINPGDSKNLGGTTVVDGDTIRVIHNPSDKIIWEGEYES